MTDDEIENLLRQVRPAGPPAALRARIAGASAKPAWPWLAAAAALLLLTTSLQFGSARLRQQAQPAVTASTDAESELASSLQASLGLSGNEARMLAVLDGIRFRIEAARTTPERSER